jgi:kinesin family protein 15
MNRESSRSHAVFSLIIDAYDESEDGIRTHRQSRFSMVDLAGSERQRDTSATGERLKEAGVINRSLSALGNVIKALSERGKTVVDSSKHIQYRDSKLTFLLRDSIGGNSKTVLIATISPAETSMAETVNIY